MLSLVGTALLLVPSSFDPGALPCFRDLLDFFYPMKVQLARALAAGDLPHWDPYTLGGHPFLANLQSQVLYPPSWLTAALHPAWGLSWSITLHFLIAGTGALLLARHLGLSSRGALLTGGIFMAGGPLASCSDLLNQLCTLSWLPWTCLAASTWAARPGRRTLACWSATLALSFLAAAPQHALVNGLFSLVFALVISRRPAHSLRGLTLASLLAIACCMAQLVPFLELVARSDRLDDAPFHRDGLHSLHPAQLTSLLVAPTSPFDAPAGAYLRSLYVGGGVLALAAIGCLRRDRWTATWVGLGLSCLVLATGPDAWLQLASFLRYPIKFICPSLLCLALLAGRGLDLGLGALASHLAPTPVRLLGGGLVLLVLLDLGLTHRRLHLAQPIDSLLRPDAVTSLLAANTGPCGPRVHSPGLDAERLRRRAERLAAGDLLGALRERVELLEGGLPAVFSVHATWGGAALTEARHARRLDRLTEGPDPVLLAELDVGFVLGPRGQLSFGEVVAESTDAEVRLLPAHPADERHRRQLDGPNRVVGPPGLGPPSDYPGWREGPPGTWTYRPSGWTLLWLLNLGGLLIWLACFVGPRRQERSSQDAENEIDSPAPVAG
ncbi:MAG: hypothetical protein AAF533_25410 [Acidobacteriota bacterium]